MSKSFLTKNNASCLKANEQIRRENFGEHLITPVLRRPSTLNVEVTACSCLFSRHSQCDHCTDRWRVAGAPAHQCTTTGKKKIPSSLIQRQELSHHFAWQFSGAYSDSFACVFHQAEEARSLGAIVYCVGVKDFNETQVTQLENISFEKERSILA